MTWAAISPPRGGWVAAAGSGRRAAPLAPPPAGIDEVAAAVPTDAGEAIVHRVRSEVWSRPVDGRRRTCRPARRSRRSAWGSSREDEPVSIFETGPWTRLTTSRGHVLVKRRGGLL